MPSFDSVSKTDMTSVDNALQGIIKEMRVRYDFKGSKSEVSKTDETITILADDDQRSLIETALAMASKRVVLHWPAKAAPLEGLRQASHPIIGKSIRYDVFMTG